MDGGTFNQSYRPGMFIFFKFGFKESRDWVEEMIEQLRPWIALQRIWVKFLNHLMVHHCLYQ